MAFGQAAGPPASARQVQELLSLLEAAGHSDFRDARGPMGFNQRQAGGRFTRDEASAFIDQLQDAEHEPVTPTATVAPRRSPFERILRSAASEDLAAELERRGFLVARPSPDPPSGR